MATPAVLRAAAENRDRAALGIFTELLVEALEDPVIERKVYGIVRRNDIRRDQRRRPPADVVAGTAGAQALKASRLAARGRGSRG